MTRKVQEKKNLKILKSLSNRALTDTDLLCYAKKLEIPNFRGVFMRNDLPKTGPLFKEAVIINLDDKNGRGTHWTCYRKNGKSVRYFNSFGNLKPPAELIQYMNNNEIKYNYKIYQEFNTVNCGHLCLKFLCNQLNI